MLTCFMEQMCSTMFHRCSSSPSVYLSLYVVLFTYFTEKQCKTAFQKRSPSPSVDDGILKSVGGRFRFIMGCRKKCRTDPDCVGFKHVSANDPERPAKGTCYWYMDSGVTEGTTKDTNSDFRVKTEICEDNNK